MIQVHRPSQSLVLPAAMKSFLADLPHKEITADGNQFVAVRHNLESYAKLRDCGIEVPHPMAVYYDWPKLQNRYNPMPHQMVAAQFMADNKRCFNLSQPRTGKTYSTMLTFDYLRKAGLIKRMVIFSTLSTVTTVWQQIIWESFSWYTSGVIHGGREKIDELLAYNFDILVINHDGVKNDSVKKYIMANKDIDMICWDEADNLGNAQSAMWKSMHSILMSHHRFIELTGTPTGENPLSVWSMTKLVNPANIPKYFGAWRQMVMNQICAMPPIWKPKKDANATVHRVMQPAICFLKSEVIELPELTHTRIECDLSAEQKKMYESMRKTMEMEHKSGEKVLAMSASDKVLKLLQVSLGSYKIGDKEYQDLDCQPRIDKILECLASTPRKTVIFVPFTGAMKTYHKAISKHYTSAMVYGDTSKKDRDKIFGAFQSSDEPHVLVCHPATTAHGLEFSIADKIIWAGPSQRGIHFLQANERIASALQKHPMTIYYIGSTPVEWKRFDSLIAKRDDQSALLDLYQMVVNHKA